MTWKDVRRVGLALPGVEEGTAWGVPALRAAGKVLACTAMHRSAEANSAVVMIPFDTREALLAEQPDVYYLKDHYAAHACVLVRLSRINEDALRDLLLMAQRAVTAARTSGASSRASRLTPRASRRTSRTSHLAPRASRPKRA